MKRVYKVILLFLAIFLVGIVSFGSYINASLKKTTDIRDVRVKRDTLKKASAAVFFFN